MKLTKVLPILAAFATLPCLAQDSPPPAAPPAPFTGYVGRYLDSTITPEWFAPYRTLRADMMKIDRDHDRLYLKAGNGVFGSYRLSTFTSRAAAGPLAIGPRGEQYLPFEMSVNPERPGSGWQVTLQDGSERFLDFDFDSRGYVYLAYTLFGWGIVDQRGVLVRQEFSSDRRLSRPATQLHPAFSASQSKVVTTL